MIGTSLSHYRVTARLGAGGMGEVYRATDAKLGRDVAIKVLPAEVAGDSERLTRFEREAKLLASLNHSSIAHVYGFESAALPDGSSAHFLAMELVEGEDRDDPPASACPNGRMEPRGLEGPARERTLRHHAVSATRPHGTTSTPLHLRAVSPP